MNVVLYMLFCRTDSFNISLNGQDVLDNDSVLLTDLGIVNGDLIYILQNAGEQENALACQDTTVSSRETLHTNQQVPSTSVEHTSYPAQVQCYLFNHKSFQFQYFKTPGVVN